jgi:predicted aspartyl protease
MARILLILLILLAAATTARAACRVQPQTSVPLRVVHGAILVEVMINDRPARMILDTGAQRSVVSKEAVQRLDLALDEWVATTMRGVGGVERNRNALPRSLTLGGLPLERRTRTRDTSLTVASLTGAAFDGLLGRDFLAPFDLDLDLRSARVTLHRVEDCRGAFLPWESPYLPLPVSNPADSALVVTVRLDGVALRALLDTGAGSTVLAAPGMARMGLTLEALARSPQAQAAGLGPRTVVGWRHRFASLDAGGLRTEDAELWVAPVRLTPIVDMLLGADWLAGKRVWISFTTRQVFVERPSG